MFQAAFARGLEISSCPTRSSISLLSCWGMKRRGNSPNRVPSLTKNCIWSLSSSLCCTAIARNGAFGDTEAEFQKLPVNSRGAPRGILIQHPTDRTSASIFGLPRVFGCEHRRQNNLKPARCQATTVSGLTMTRTFLHAGQRRRSRIQNIRSWTRSRGRGCFRLSTPSC